MEHITRKYEKPEVGVTQCVMVESVLAGGSIVSKSEMNYVSISPQAEGLYITNWSTDAQWNHTWVEE